MSDEGWRKGWMMDGGISGGMEHSKLCVFINITPPKKHDTMHYFVHRHHILDRAAAF